MSRGAIVLVLAFGWLGYWILSLWQSTEHRALWAAAAALERLPTEGPEARRIWAGNDPRIFGYSKWFPLAAAGSEANLEHALASVSPAGAGEWNVQVPVWYTYRDNTQSLVRAKRVFHAQVTLASGVPSVTSHRFARSFPLPLWEQIAQYGTFIGCLIVGPIAGLFVFLISAAVGWVVSEVFGAAGLGKMIAELPVAFLAGFMVAIAGVLVFLSPIMAFGSLWARALGIILNLLIVRLIVAMTEDAF